MLPRTLATIGESLMKQTGWPITILAGGPMPDSDGMIMTFVYVNCLFNNIFTDSPALSRSHTGKTKVEESFEKYLGKKEYDECILRPFEKFLHATFCKLYEPNFNIITKNSPFHSRRGLCFAKPCQR